MADPPAPKRFPINRLSYRQLLIAPILFSAAFIAVVVIHSMRDVNQGLLYSQCHARSRVPFLSTIPVIGAPACYLVSSLHEALASARSGAVIGEIVAFLGGLLTLCTVEAARACNAGARLVAHPTGPWLVLNLAGALAGQLAWGCVIVPAFLRRSKGLASLKEEAETSGNPSAQELAVDSRDLIYAAEAIAVPVAVAGGFVAPSLVMVLTNSEVAIFVWLFFPVYVAVIRRVVRWVLIKMSPERAAPSFRLERSKKALAGVYGVPAACSVAAHAWAIYKVFFSGVDDRKEMGRSAAKFFEIDAAFVGATLLYWLLVEGGLKPAGVLIVVGAVFGPGAGAVAAWAYREWVVHGAGLVEGGEEDENEGRQGADEETPLLS